MYTFCSGVGLLLAGVIVLALVVKWQETRRAAAWCTANGVVIRIRVRSMRRFNMDGRSRSDILCRITPAYPVGGDHG